MSKLEVGDLVRIDQQEGTRQWTLCNRATRKGKALEECLSFGDVKDDWNKIVYKCFYGKIGLIKKIITNKLDQPLIYELEFPEGTYSCKAILAGKYLKKVTK